MCHLAQTGLSDELLLEMCVSARPIMVFKKQLKDNSRKYMEIFEATGVSGGRLRGRMLYRFAIIKTELRRLFQNANEKEAQISS